jgi:hypothetical protein
MSATYQQALLTLQRKRTGGGQHVTVKHIHQQVNVTEESADRVYCTLGLPPTEDCAEQR